MTVRGSVVFALDKKHAISATSNLITEIRIQLLQKCLTTTFTGLRIGEICALKWGDISFSENTLSVHQTMQRIQNTDIGGNRKTRVLISAPKSSCSIRVIPLPQNLKPLLLKHHSIADTYILSGSADCYIEPRNIQSHFKQVLKNCLIPDANFHSLRHTFATRCVEVEFDIKSLSEVLGHASVTITMNRYVHPSMDLKQKNMDRLTGLFSVK